MDNARDLFEHELRDLYDAEHKLVRATAKMAETVSDPKLSSSFAEHSRVTEGHVKRLEQVFESIGRAPRREACPGINGLIEEYSKFLKEEPQPDVLDFFAIGAALKVEQYEIQAYTSLIALAETLGIDSAPLMANLAEEQETAAKLLGEVPAAQTKVPVGASAS